jgi:membrane fusion protein, multidrug efflux system
MDFERRTTMRLELRTALCVVSILFLSAGHLLRADAPPPAPADEKKADNADTGHLKVPVARPIAREVTDYVDFTGQTEASQSVNVRARVSGCLLRAPFQEGAIVKEGDLLFEIDPRPYRAQLDHALGQVELRQASLKLARTTLARNEARAKSVPGSVSQEELDQARAAVEEAEARLKVSQAGAEAARLELNFTHVSAPISGRVGRRLVDIGNLVTADTTPLATIVNSDPMYVSFDLDENTLLRLRRLAQLEKKSSPEAGKLTVHFGLSDEKDFPRRATVNFIDNHVDPGKGTLRVRAVTANPDQFMIPGLFVRVRIPIGGPRKALLVPERAVGSDQDRKFVYVVDEKGTAIVRRVRTGGLQDGLRIIDEGLSPDDRVIVTQMFFGNLIQRLRTPTVDPQLVPISPDRP